MFKYKNSMLPSNFNNLFHTNAEIHSYNTRNAKNLRIPKVNTQLADNFISKTGVISWNNLQTTMECNTSISIFKKRLLMLLISTYDDYL